LSEHQKPHINKKSKQTIYYLNNIIIIMPKNIIIDMTNFGTYRPKIAFLKIKNDHFEPIKLPKFITEIHFPNHMFADDPITIFILYYILEIIK
jgi:hypothetical protein